MQPVDRSPAWLREPLFRCLCCGVEECSKWRNSVDGPATLCGPCGKEYRGLNMRLFMDPVSEDVSIRELPGRVPVRVVGFKMLSPKGNRYSWYDPVVRRESEFVNPIAWSAVTQNTQLGVDSGARVGDQGAGVVVQPRETVPKQGLSKGVEGESAGPVEGALGDAASHAQLPGPPVQGAGQQAVVSNSQNSSSTWITSTFVQVKPCVIKKKQKRSIRFNVRKGKKSQKNASACPQDTLLEPQGEQNQGDAHADPECTNQNPSTSGRLANILDKHAGLQEDVQTTRSESHDSSVVIVRTSFVESARDSANHNDMMVPQHSLDVCEDAVDPEHNVNTLLHGSQHGTAGNTLYEDGRQGEAVSHESVGEAGENQEKDQHGPEETNENNYSENIQVRETGKRVIRSTEKWNFFCNQRQRKPFVQGRNRKLVKREFEFDRFIMKVKYRDELQLFMFRDDVPFASILDSVRVAFKTQGDLRLKYLDDEGDTVTLASDEGMDALRDMIRTQGLRKIHLEVFDVE